MINSKERVKRILTVERILIISLIKTIHVFIVLVGLVKSSFMVLDFFKNKYYEYRIR